MRRAVRVRLRLCAREGARNGARKKVPLYRTRRSVVVVLVAIKEATSETVSLDALLLASVPRAPCSLQVRQLRGRERERAEEWKVAAAAAARRARRRAQRACVSSAGAPAPRRAGQSLPGAGACAGGNARARSPSTRAAQPGFLHNLERLDMEDRPTATAASHRDALQLSRRLSGVPMTIVRRPPATTPHHLLGRVSRLAERLRGPRRPSLPPSALGRSCSPSALPRLCTEPRATPSAAYPSLA